MTDFPTPDQVREARRAAGAIRPDAAVFDQEAARARNIATAIQLRRERDAADRADLDRVVVAIAGLWGRDALPPVEKQLLLELVHHLKVALGPMVPPTALAPDGGAGRDAHGRFVGRR